jgi:hypothetical protein
MGPSNKFHLERLLNPFGVFLHGGSLWIDTLVLEVVLFLHFYHTAPALAQDSHDPAWTHIGCDMRVRRLWRTHRVNMSDSDRGHGVVQSFLSTMDGEADSRLIPYSDYTSHAVRILPKDLLSTHTACMTSRGMYRELIRPGFHAIIRFQNNPKALDYTAPSFF